MESKKIIVYKLFAMRTNDKNVAIATQYRFQRITPTYILVYGEDKPEGTSCTEVTVEDIQSLSRRDLQWLEDANIVLLREFADEHKDAQKNSMKNFLTELDRNIKEELGKDGERDKQSETE